MYVPPHDLETKQNKKINKIGIKPSTLHEKIWNRLTVQLNSFNIFYETFRLTQSINKILK